MLLGGARGDHDDGQGLDVGPRAQPRGQLQPVEARHFEVDQQRRRSALVDFFERLDAVPGGARRVAFAVEKPGE